MKAKISISAPQNGHRSGSTSSTLWINFAQLSQGRRVDLSVAPGQEVVDDRLGDQLLLEENS
jgi:hypothetical protein